MGMQEKISKIKVWQMFNRIAKCYDILNHILSFGQDIIWRKKVSTFLPSRSDLSLLDIATGTANQIISIFQQNENISAAVGIDKAKKMLQIGGNKIIKHQLQDKVKLKEGDATNLEFENDTFDVITITFGIRNFVNISLALKEILRVLKPDGRMIILEFSLPNNKLFRNVFLFYFRNILPHLGGFISGDRYAYRYLNETVETFPFGKEFVQLLKDGGFVNINVTPLTLGIATIYWAEKAKENRLELLVG
jgi:demethylmenaquinone methyltransferase/2-methoxy-6-polyprenyl-1,4-benzoquinol methylase